METERKKLGVDGDAASILLTNMYYSQWQVINELVANAIDAGSTKTTVTLSDKGVTVSDNGSGMDWQTLNTHFLWYGRSNKKSDPSSMGSFGIGAKSPMQFSKSMTVETVKDGLMNVVVIEQTDDGAFFDRVVADRETDRESGTIITIPFRDEHSEISWRNSLKHFKEDALCESVTVEGVDVDRVESYETLLSVDGLSFVTHSENKSFFLDKKSMLMKLYIHMCVADGQNVSGMLPDIVVGPYKIPSSFNDGIFIKVDPGTVDVTSDRMNVVINERFHTLVDRAFNALREHYGPVETLALCEWEHPSIPATDFIKIVASLYSRWLAVPRFVRDPEIVVMFSRDKDDKITLTEGVTLTVPPELGSAIKSEATYGSMRFNNSRPLTRHLMSTPHLGSYDMGRYQPALPYWESNSFMLVDRVSNAIAAASDVCITSNQALAGYLERSGMKRVSESKGSLDDGATIRMIDKDSNTVVNIENVNFDNSLVVFASNSRHSGRDHEEMGASLIRSGLCEKFFVIDVLHTTPVSQVVEFANRHNLRGKIINQRIAGSRDEAVVFDASYMAPIRQGMSLDEFAYIAEHHEGEGKGFLEEWVAYSTGISMIVGYTASSMHLIGEMRDGWLKRAILRLPERDPDMVFGNVLADDELHDSTLGEIASLYRNRVLTEAECKSAVARVLNLIQG